MNYSKLPVIWHVLRMGFASYINLPDAREKLLQEVKITYFYYSSSVEVFLSNMTDFTYTVTQS
jgi:hypothetical protein